MQRSRVRMLLGGAVAAATLALAVATPAIAGGWATVLIDHETSAPAGTAGQPIDVTFTVLQHGITPVNTGEATVVAVDSAGGDVVRVAATPTGSGGIYRATVVFPHEGTWRWRVELGGLVAHSQFQDVTVDAAPAATTPAAGIDLLPVLVVAVGGGILAAGALGLAARAAGRRRTPEAASPR